MGARGEAFSGTTIKDTWTKPRGVGSRVGRGEAGVGGVVGGKFRQLHLNNNKKVGKKQLSLLFPDSYIVFFVQEPQKSFVFHQISQSSFYITLIQSNIKSDKFKKGEA